MDCWDGVAEVLLLGSQVSLSRQESSYKVAEVNKEKLWIFTSAIETDMYTVYLEKQGKQAEKER